MEQTISDTHTSQAIDGKSANIAEEKQHQLKALFPEAFTEGKIDFAQLRALLGDMVEDDQQHYGLSWAGKYEAFREIQKQTTATLVPDREESIDFDTTGNIFIEGENLEVLRVLQKSYYGKVKMIYIDPPYNTGNDHFIYPDDFAERLEEYQKRTGIKDEEGFLNKQDLWKKNTRENGHFHSVWLSMMYPRLYLARNLLRDDGVIFVSIDDNEVANLRQLMDEVFGEENFVAQLVWERGRKNDAKLFSIGHEYILVYIKSIQPNIVWREEKPGARDILAEYQRLKKIHRDNLQAIQDGIRAFYSKLPKNHPALKHRRYNRIDQNGIWRDDNISWPGGNGPRYEVIHPVTGQPCKIPDAGWRFSTLAKFKLYDDYGFIFFREDHTSPPMLKRYLNHVPTIFDPDVRRLSTGESDGKDEVNVQVMPSVFYKNAQPTIKAFRKIMGSDLFSNPKDPDLLQRWISYVTERDSIILDFFAGSGTTAHAVLDLNREDGGNRKFICVQMPEPTDEKSDARKAGYESIADISRARIRKVIEKIKSEDAGKLDLETPGDLGFRSYRIAPSNFKAWRGTVEGQDMETMLLEFQEAHRKGADAESMVTELLLKAGLPLTANVEPVSIGATRLFNVGDGTMIVLLERIEDAVRDYLLETKPAHVVCLDTVFENNDQLLTNLGLQLEEAGIELTVI